MSKCPRCKREIPTYEKESATIIRDDKTQIRGLLIVCPECKNIVGVVENSFQLGSIKQPGTNEVIPIIKEVMRKAVEE